MCFSLSNRGQESILIAGTCDSRKRSFKLFDQLVMYAKPRYKLVRVIKERNANKPIGDSLKKFYDYVRARGENCTQLDAIIIQIVFHSRHFLSPHVVRKAFEPIRRMRTGSRCVEVHYSRITRATP